MSEKRRHPDPDIINYLQEIPLNISRQEKKRGNHILNELNHMEKSHQFGKVSSFPESRVLVARSSPPDTVRVAISLIVDPSAAKIEKSRKRRLDRIETLQALSVPVDEQGIIQEAFHHGRVGELEFGWIRSAKNQNFYVVEIWMSEGVVRVRREYLIRAENYAGLFKAVGDIKKLLAR